MAAWRSEVTAIFAGGPAGSWLSAQAAATGNTLIHAAVTADAVHWPSLP